MRLPTPSFVFLLAFGFGSGVAAGACGSTNNSTFTDGGTGSDGTLMFGGDGGINHQHDVQLVGPVDTGAPSQDAFFVNDPPPKYCGVEGGTAPPMVGGTEMCPSDKNLPGCPCGTLGTTAPCWTGLRVNRGLGDCKDGTATCISADEGTENVWSGCQGEVLPVMGATGAAACKCFSSGQWAIADLDPCFEYYNPPDSGPPPYVVSSSLNGTTVVCPMETPPGPPPVPSVPWSDDTVKVDCAGQFTLCYTIKAGSASNPQPTDCVIGKSCVSGAYPTANVVQAFPPLPAWGNLNNQACAATFLASGGYGEMTVQGQSIYCEGIGADDGGAPEVFNRVPYCSFACTQNPMGSGCGSCQTMGGGTFGH
jgi:hypothetical protein